MSTIPLTLIEGAIALPRLRPLDRLPAPFGRDWALLPPGYSWRAELKALYAAVLRTFCMSDQIILSFCRWVPLNTRRAAASATAATAQRATIFDAPRDEAPRVPAEAAAAAAAERPAVTSVSRGSPPHWGALAGGACTLGGAAMLAWLAAGHLAHRQTIDTAEPANTIAATRDASPAKRSSSDVVSDRATVVGKVHARTRHVAAARADAATSTVAPGSTSIKAIASPHASANQALARRHRTFRDRIGSLHGTTHRQFARSAAAHPLSSVVPRALPRPSVAGNYSPFAPARLGTSEYAAVTMSAATHLRELAPPSRHALSNSPSVTSATEWMDHMSQRRVTDIPDQFAK
ncbi:conserved hypothetical protein [Paraburkholderia ribeironis]|uniref:Uncharacterized protein n=1 Tax=Paraburkholderia ribeironis TaxID=1247936 RepID=A0A1N7RYX2_9BURK|nr:hypothetical protein [Paraburkholderia ribeironis]SIT40269.1 conserved hypothetical protein [Paraburkholderia ribeironis]